MHLGLLWQDLWSSVSPPANLACHLPYLSSQPPIVCISAALYV